MVEEKSKRETIAKMDIQRDLSSQKTNLKVRLAQRKANIELRNSGFFDDEEGMNMVKK
jgi:hypothetical protein